MIDWQARARVEISRKHQTLTPETPIKDVPGVMGVRPEGACESPRGVLGALGVGATGVREDAPRPYRLLKVDADRCHAGGWNDDEIGKFTTRVVMFVRRGIHVADADDLAERLTLRDRERDDRHLCLECAHLMTSGRCAAAALGHLAGADQRMEPVPTILMRCGEFAGALRP